MTEKDKIPFIFNQVIQPLPEVGKKHTILERFKELDEMKNEFSDDEYLYYRTKYLEELSSFPKKPIRGIYVSLAFLLLVFFLSFYCIWKEMPVSYLVILLAPPFIFCGFLHWHMMKVYKSKQSLSFEDRLSALDELENSGFIDKQEKQSINLSIHKIFENKIKA